MTNQAPTYVAKSGVLVFTPNAHRTAEDDFPTLIHYTCWSWRNWGRMIAKTLQNDARSRLTTRRKVA
jgi:hypothetical protein